MWHAQQKEPRCWVCTSTRAGSAVHSWSASPLLQDAAALPGGEGACGTHRPALVVGGQQAEGTWATGCSKQREHQDRRPHPGANVGVGPACPRAQPLA